MTNLHSAAASGDLTALRNILATRPDIDAQDDLGRTPLMVATYANHVEVVRLLLEQGANPDQRDHMLNNPFLYAGAEGLLDVLMLVNDAEADPAITNRYGGVAIIPAAEHGHIAVIQYLLANTDIDVDHVNNLGWSALLEAIILSDGGPLHQKVVTLLLAGGADPDLRDAEGVSPLTHAEQRGYLEIVEILRSAGAQD